LQVHRQWIEFGPPIWYSGLRPPEPRSLFKHVRGLAELRRLHEVHGAAEVQVIEDVGEIGSRLKANVLGKAKMLAHRR
jgi:hypothetical protein